jgi:hypothetical protein
VILALALSIPGAFLSGIAGTLARNLAPRKRRGPAQAATGKEG